MDSCGGDRELEASLVKALLDEPTDQTPASRRALFSRLADDYDTLSLMNELPESADAARDAIATLPDVSASTPSETATMLARVYRRTVQLLGQ